MIDRQIVSDTFSQEIAEKKMEKGEAQSHMKKKDKEGGGSQLLEESRKPKIYIYMNTKGFFRTFHLFSKRYTE